MFKVLTAISAIGAVYAQPGCDMEMKSVLYRMIGNMSDGSGIWFDDWEGVDAHDSVYNALVERKVYKRVELMPKCGKDVATMMHVNLVGGDLNDEYDDDDDEINDRRMDFIAFNGQFLTDRCDSNTRRRNDDDAACSVENVDCGDFDVTEFIRRGDDAINVVSASARNAGARCGMITELLDDDTDTVASGGESWMLLITFHCADTPVKYGRYTAQQKTVGRDRRYYNGVARAEHALGHSSSAVSSSSQDSSFAAAALLSLIGLVAGFVAAKFVVKKPQFEAVADSSAHVSQKEFEFGTSSNYPPVRL